MTKNNSLKPLAQVASVQQTKQQQQRQQPMQKVAYKKNNKTDQDLASYAAALSDPFSDLAIGAQTPDMYSYPTTTAHCEGTVTLNANAAGAVSLLLGPDPFLAMLDMTGGVASTGMASYGGSNSTSYAAVTNSALSGLLSNFRLVGAGFEIRNLQPPTSAIGRVMVAKVPAIGPVPGPNMLANVTMTVQALAGMYVNNAPSTATIGFASDILELPEAEEFTVQDLITNCLEINLKPTSPDGFNFHSTTTGDNVSTTVSLTAGGEAPTAGGSLAAYYDNPSNMAIDGWDTILLLANGFAASATNVLEIKYIYHFEGTPALNNSAGALVPDGKPKAHINQLGHMAVLDKVLSNPTIKLASKLIGAAAQAYFTPERAAASVMAKLGLTL